MAAFQPKGTCKNSFDVILKAPGLPHYGMHSLRHTFTTRLLKKVRNQQELKEAAEIIGNDYNVIISTLFYGFIRFKTIYYDTLVVIENTFTSIPLINSKVITIVSVTKKIFYFYLFQ